MPLEIRKNDMTKEGAPAPLLELIRAHHERLADVRLDYLKGREYVTTRMSVGVQRIEELEQLDKAKVSEDDYDESPEEIAAAVFDLAAEHAQGSGADKYRAVVWGNKGGKYAELDRVIFVVTIDHETGDVRGDEAPIGREEVLKLSTTIAKTSHEQHMKSLEKIPPLLNEVVGLVKEVAGLAGPMAQAKVDLRRIDLEQEEARFESEDRQHMWGVSRDVLLKLMSVFGVQLADAWKAAGFPGAPPKPKAPDGVEQIGNLVTRWDAVFARIGPDKLTKLSEIMGEDLATLAEKMRTAKDDEMFKNMASELMHRSKQEPDWAGRLMKIHALLGDELGGEFATVLGEAAP